MNQKKVISFQTRLDSFHFLGIENVLAENADFGAVWVNFFSKGGYDVIAPYETDPHCVNVWYNRPTGETVYFQGKMVRSDAQAPEHFTLASFPAAEYLVVTTEWLTSYQESMQHINHDYWKNAPIPEGYRKRTDTETGVFMLERWGANTGEGYRYEFWLPIEKTQG